MKIIILASVATMAMNVYASSAPTVHVKNCSDHNCSTSANASVSSSTTCKIKQSHLYSQLTCQGSSYACFVPGREGIGEWQHDYDKKTKQHIYLCIADI